MALSTSSVDAAAAGRGLTPTQATAATADSTIACTIRVKERLMVVPALEWVLIPHLWVRVAKDAARPTPPPRAMPVLSQSPRHRYSRRGVLNSSSSFLGSTFTLTPLLTVTPFVEPA